MQLGQRLNKRDSVRVHCSLEIPYRVFPFHVLTDVGYTIIAEIYSRIIH